MPDLAQTVHRTWRLTLAYDGTDFRGWQVQPGETTVQGELQSSLGRVTGESPLPQGSGRTDAGVHALAQVASFPLAAPIPPENLLRALNRTLPPSIRVLDASIVADSFHARHSAVAKTYEYRVWNPGRDSATICSPFLFRYVYACPWALDRHALQAAAQRLVGEHDFRSFAATDPDVSARTTDQAAVPPEEDPLHSTVRTLFSSDWEERTTDRDRLLVYRVRGDGFLHHMVRNLVGTMLDVGRGHLPVQALERILAARSRAEAGATAPARGLFLHSVEYESAGPA